MSFQQHPQQRNMQSRDMQSFGHSIVPAKLETQSFDHRPGLSAPPPMSAQSLSPDSLEGELKTPTSDTAPHQSLPLHLGEKPALANQTQPAVHQASSRDEYFKGGTTNSSDYIIDIWNERIDLLSCPPDVQAYLECASGSVYGAHEKLGISKFQSLKAGLLVPIGANGSVKFDGLKEGIVPAVPYTPNVERMQLGLEVLREQAQKRNGLFLPPHHQFPRKAFEQYPHYPWMFDLDENAREELVQMAERPCGKPRMGPSFLLLGNVRIGLPDDLPGPRSNPYWSCIIGAAYGTQSPLVISTTNPRFGDRAINLRVQYGVGGMGRPRFRDPDDYDMEGFSDPDDSDSD